jgi:hypothetical protein
MGGLKHATQGTELSQTEFEVIESHTVASEARGDLMYRDATGWGRLSIGASGQGIQSDGTDVAWGNNARRYATGSTVVTSHDGEVSTDSTSYAKIAAVRVGKIGTVSVIFDLRKNGSVTGYGRIYRNGIAVGTERSTTSSSFVTQSAEDITVLPGDTLELWAYISVTGFTFAQNFRVRCDHSDTASGRDIT